MDESKFTISLHRHLFGTFSVVLQIEIRIQMNKKKKKSSHKNGGPSLYLSLAAFPNIYDLEIY